MSAGDLTGLDDSDEAGDPVARIGQRVGARALDWGLLLGGWLLLGGATSERLEDGSLTNPRWAILLWMLVVIVYEAGFVSIRGQTLGKIALGIEIVSLRDGGRPPLPAAIARVAPVGLAMALLGSFFPIALVFLYFSAAFMKNTRGIIDLIAGTVVIEARNRSNLLG